MEWSRDTKEKKKKTHQPRDRERRKRFPHLPLAVLHEARHLLFAGEERRQGLDENVAAAERAHAPSSGSFDVRVVVVVFFLCIFSIVPGFMSFMASDDNEDGEGRK